MTGLQALHFSCPWSQAVGGQISCVPLLLVWVFLSGQNPTARHWSTQLVLTRVAWISTAHLLTEESAAAAQDSPSTNWSLPAHTAPSPWCCHNGNEMNCKLHNTPFITWLRYEDVRFKMCRFIHWLKCFAPVVALWDEMFYFTFILELLSYTHSNWHLHSCPVQPHSFNVTVQLWRNEHAFLKGTLKLFFSREEIAICIIYIYCKHGQSAYRGWAI